MTEQQIMKQQYNLKENIKHNDLAELINTTFSVDQYKSKLGEDENIIVIAFVVMDLDPAQELSQFLETGHDAFDIDVSTGPNEDGHYSVYVETLNVQTIILSRQHLQVMKIKLHNHGTKKILITA